MVLTRNLSEEADTLGKMKELIREEQGQGMAEYAFILLAVAMIAMVGYFALGNGLLDRVNEIATHEAFS